MRACCPYLAPWRADATRRFRRANFAFYAFARARCLLFRALARWSLGPLQARTFPPLPSPRALARWQLRAATGAQDSAFAVGAGRTT
jgi:hypothetical protein